MIEVTQKLVSDVNGDCFGACIASLLELDDWPNFHTDKTTHWIDKWNDWLAQRGLSIIHLFGVVEPPRGYAIASVESKVFPGQSHSVIHLNGVMVWNPSPLRDEGVGELRYHWVLVPLDPARGNV